ncbi:MAG TPA: PIN domain-containing protein, partial [Chloroflexota bacterium]
MTQLVVDASVLLSAAVGRPDTPPALLLEAARAGNVELVICDRLIDEVRAGLDQPYFRARVTGSEAAALVGMLGA